MWFIITISFCVLHLKHTCVSIEETETSEVNEEKLDEEDSNSTQSPHFVNDTRLEDLLWQAENAEAINDKYGKNLYRELHTRRSFSMNNSVFGQTPLPSRRGPIFSTHYYATNTEIFIFILHLMQESVYIAQEKLRYLDGPLNKYGSEFRFQLGYTFRVIEELRTDIRKLYTQLRRDEHKRSTGWFGGNVGYKMYTANTYLHLFYYSHAFKKFIDITYIVEQVCAKFERYRQNKKKSSAVFYKGMMIGMGNRPKG